VNKRTNSKIVIESKSNINYSKKTTKESDYSEKNNYYEQLKDQLLPNNAYKNDIILKNNQSNQISKNHKTIINKEDNLNKSVKSLSEFNLNKDDYIEKKENDEKFFNAILKNQFKNEYHEIYNFMDKIGLSQFTDNFIKSGFNTIEKIVSKRIN
jgi:hypothetical protein